MMSYTDKTRRALRFSLACAALMTLIATSHAAVVKGPYLIYPGNPTQMGIHWQLGGTTTCTLQWGRDIACADGTMTSNEGSVASHQHATLLTGLVPGKQYHFRIREGTAEVHRGTFHAAPPADAMEVKFMAYGDTRTQLSVNNAISGAMMGEITTDPAYQSFVLHVGDWVSSNSELAWSNEFFALDGPNIKSLAASLPILGCLGNHEGSSGTNYRKYWPYPYPTSRFYWSFDYGPVHVTVIDQYDQAGGPSDVQVDWIRNDLATSAKPWKFLLYHEPAWTASSSSHGNNLRAQAVLQPLCEKYGVSLCFSGHVHFYAHCQHNGVHHLTLGGGGAPLYTPNPTQPDYVVTTAKEYHYARIEIEGNTLKFTALKPDGTVIEAFSIAHPKSTKVGWGWKLFK